MPSRPTAQDLCFRHADVEVSVRDGVVVYDFSEVVRVDAAYARDLLDAVLAELVRRGVTLPRPVLVRLGRVSKVTREAREVFATSPSNARIASRVALVATLPIAVVLGNVFLGLNPPAHPTELFATDEEALAWLRG